MSFSRNPKKTRNGSVIRSSRAMDDHHLPTSSDPEETYVEQVVTPTRMTPRYSDSGETPKVGILFHFSQQIFQVPTLQSGYQDQVEETIFEGSPDAIYTLGQCVWTGVTLGVAGIFYWFKTLPIEYRITTQRIFIKRGVFSTKTDIIELIDVKRFWLEHPWQMRCLGYGILHIVTSNFAFPRVRLQGIKEIENVYKELRRSVFDEQKRRGVKLLRKVDV